MPISEV